MFERGDMPGEGPCYDQVRLENGEAESPERENSRGNCPVRGPEYGRLAGRVCAHIPHRHQTAFAEGSRWRAIHKRAQRSPSSERE